MCVLEQCISKVSKYKSDVESLLKLGSWVPPGDSDSGLMSGPECAALTSSQVKHGALEQLSGLWNKTNSSSHPPVETGYVICCQPWSNFV